LDEREQSVFKDGMDAGNLYINRTTTGAIVARQPFGGRKGSCFGPGAKAGGPNYILQFVHVATDGDRAVDERVPADLPGDVGIISQALRRAAGLSKGGSWEKITGDYQAAWDSHFSKEHQFVEVRGEDNLFRYQPLRSVGIIVGKNAERTDVGLAIVAALIAGVPFTLYLTPEKAIQRSTFESVLGSLRLSRFSELEPDKHSRLRCIGVQSSRLSELRERVEPELYIDTTCPAEAGRVELLKWCREQSVCVEFHRYGNLGLRED